MLLQYPRIILYRSQSSSSFLPKYCKENGIKCILALSKIDRPFLNDNLINDLESSLGTKPVPLQAILKDGDKLMGVQPLFTLKPNGDIERNDLGDTEEAWTVSSNGMVIQQPIVPV